MKRLVITFLSLLSCGSAFALPVGNPSEASLFLQGAWWESYCSDPCDPCFSWCEAWSLRIGYYGDFVFNRHLKIGHDGGGSDIDKTEIFTNACYLVFNICDRLDFFGTLGATNICIKTDARSWGFLGSLESELFFSTDLSWSVGGRATIWECDWLGVGLEGQYFQTNTNFDSFLEYADGQIAYFNSDNSAHYSEWQVGLGISYMFATRYPSFAMIPYAAVKWSGSCFTLDNLTFTETINGVARKLTFPDLKSKKIWGFALGISMTLCDLIGINMEGRWADEKAVYVNGQFRF